MQAIDRIKIVADWWRVRCVEGCQLKGLDNFIEGWDYHGVGPWFPYVALAALRADFNMHRCPGHEFRAEHFSEAFNTVATFIACRTRRGVLRRADGTIHTKVGRKFYVFGEKPILDQYGQPFLNTHANSQPGKEPKNE